MSTHSTSNNLKQSQRTKVILGCIGAIIGLAVIAIMFSFVWRKRKMKHQGLPMILQETNLINEDQDCAASLQIKQQNGQSTGTETDTLVAQVQNSNSRTYRSQLSSAASAGTVITYAEGML